MSKMHMYKYVTRKAIILNDDLYLHLHVPIKKHKKKG